MNGREKLVVLSGPLYAPELARWIALACELYDDVVVATGGWRDDKDFVLSGRRRVIARTSAVPQPAEEPPVTPAEPQTVAQTGDIDGGDPTPDVACPDCGRTFKNRNALNGHLGRSGCAAPADPPLMPHVCPNCAQRFSTDLELAAHRRRHFTANEAV